MINLKTGKAKGFTLIELIIVIAILAILLATTTYAITGIQRDKKMEAGDEYAREIYYVIQDWLTDMETSGVDAFIPNDYYKHAYSGGTTFDTRYATICAFCFESTGATWMYSKQNDIYPDTTGGGYNGYPINVGGTKVGWKDVNYYPWVMKDWMFTGDAQVDMKNGLGSCTIAGADGNKLTHGYTGSRVNPEVDHDISQYIKNMDMLNQSASWLAVIDTVDMKVMWTYWFSAQGRAFTDNSQRFYNKSYVDDNGGEGAFGGSGSIWYFCQEWMYDEYGKVISCYPMADEMTDNFK